MIYRSTGEHRTINPYSLVSNCSISFNSMPKFGSVKRQHGRVDGLDAILDDIVRQCPYVSRIVPGRMGRKRGNTEKCLSVQYATTSAEGCRNGLKCIYSRGKSWQEVFLVCTDADAASEWLLRQKMVK